MPDDNLFPEGTPTETVPESTPQGNGADPQGDTPPTMAQVGELITQAQAPLLEKIENLSQIAATATQALQVQTTTPQATTTPEGPPEDFLTRFANDPEGSIRKISREISGDHLQTAVPLMSGLINSTVSNFIGRETADIDREFGDGAFAKFFDKPLGVLMDGYRRSNVAALADDNTIRREVDGLKGRMFNDLVEFRESSRKTVADGSEANAKKLVDQVTESVMTQTNLTGGIRRVNSGNEEVTEAVQGYLDERIAAIGGEETGKDFLSRTDYGNSIEDYRKHKDKMKSAEGSA